MVNLQLVTTRLLLKHLPQIMIPINMLVSPTLNMNTLQRSNFGIRKGTGMCQFKLQYQTLDDQWVDHLPFLD